MTEIIGDGATRVWWTPAGGAPVEIPAEGVKIQMQYVDPDPPMPDSGLLFVKNRLVPVRLTGHTIRLTPAGYRMLFRRTHPRVKRMHAAYGHRRKGW